jgi:hypothetical protein
MQGGSIAVDPDYERGAKFKIKLPTTKNYEVKNEQLDFAR